MSIETELSLSLSRAIISFNISLLDLPSDVVVILFEYLTLDSLCKLSLTCSYLHDLVEKFGWVAYLRLNPRRSWSLSCVENIWRPYERLRYNAQVEKRWENRKFTARPLSAPWRGKLLPVLAISPTRLIVAAGSKLDTYTFTSNTTAAASPGVQFEAKYIVQRSDAEPDARHDITGIAFIPDGGEDRNLLAGFADGYVMRVTLPDRCALQASSKEGQDTPPPLLETLYWSGDVIESLSLAGNLSLTLSGSGKANFRNLLSNVSSEIHLDAKSWSSHISTSASPYVAFGTTSPTPLVLHPIRDSALSPTPSLVLSSLMSERNALNGRESTAAYGITDPPPSFPGAPGQTIVSGWYDGFVRLYDLRSPSSSTTHWARGGQHAEVPVIKPVLSMSDPWSNEPIYAVASGGGAGYTIAAGSARHSVVAFWDVRKPRSGWSVHAPGNDVSPVYSVILESSRLFGATQSRPFVYDFGHGVTEDTFPLVPLGGGRINDGLKTTNGVHYQVTTYSHKRPMATT